MSACRGWLGLGYLGAVIGSHVAQPASTSSKLLDRHAPDTPSHCPCADTVCTMKLAMLLISMLLLATGVEASVRCLWAFHGAKELL